jgi:hypothetical protein
VVNMWEASRAFARVCAHPRVVQIVRPPRVSQPLYSALGHSPSVPDI